MVLSSRSPLTWNESHAERTRAVICLTVERFSATRPALYALLVAEKGPAARAAVAAVIEVDDVEHAIAVANDTIYGLAAAIWTTDLAKAHRVARGIRAGTVWVNTAGLYDPAVSFGGFKQSGYGRELGLHSMEAYTEQKSVWISLR